jgi:hypothetical protein
MRRLWCACLSALIVIHNFHICHAAQGSSDRGDKNDDVQWEDYNPRSRQDDDDFDSDWYFDDPYARAYYPTDDTVIAEMKANMKVYREEQQRMKEERKEHTIQLFFAGSCALFGLILGTFCTSVSLYYAKKTSLVIRYHNEGIVVEANILASEPNVEGFLKNEHEKSSSGEIKTLTKRSSDGDSEQAIHDSYSIMTDDDDDDETNYASYSSTKGSSSSESVAAADVVSKEHDNDIKNITSTPRNSNRSRAVEKKQSDFERVWNVIDQQHIPSTQRFVVVVEYRDTESASKVRKRLFIMGNDIKVSESKEMNNSPNVLLYVLKGTPKSGQCCGEIHRALKWNKQLSFFFLLSFCIVLTMVTVVTAAKMLSQTLLVAYVVVLLLLVSLQVVFLDAAFTNIIAKQYLEDGLDLPVWRLKNPSFEQKEMDMALKHGISFV